MRAAKLRTFDLRNRTGFPLPELNTRAHRFKTSAVIASMWRALGNNVRFDKGEVAVPAPASVVEQLQARAARAVERLKHRGYTPAAFAARLKTLLQGD